MNTKSAGWRPQALAALMAFGALAGSPPGRAQEAPAAEVAPAAKLSAELAAQLPQAFDYAFVLVAMGRLRATLLGDGRSPGPSVLNQWRHARALSGPQDRWVTTPNTDTLYSTLWLDLSRGPVRLSVPDMAGRYYSLAFMDMASNNFAMLGRRSSGTQAGEFVVVGPDWQQPLPAGQRVLRAPGHDVLVLARLLVDGPADLPAVQALQDRFRVQPLAADGERAAAPWEAPPPLAMGAQAFVDMANLMLERNPPPAYEEPLLKQWASLGLCGAGCRWSNLNPEVQALWSRALPELLGTLKAGLGGAGVVVNGWRYSQPDLGNFGTDYHYRAQVALGGLLALEPAEALYPNTGVDDSHQPLSGTHRYRLTLPAGGVPVNAFWSLSMYQVEPDGKLFFTANPAGRYAIGDRTPGLQTGPDGRIEIWIQHDAPTRADQLANWLPAPAGPFHLVLRAYEPRADLRDGRVTLPAVERLD